MQGNQEKYFKKFKQILVIGVILILMSYTIIMASTNDPNCVTPTDEQYFELRAISIKDVPGQNKQVIMELWGNNIEFKRI